MMTDQHEWQRGRFTGTTTCVKCGLLPLDDDDIDTECEAAADSREGMRTAWEIIGEGR
jgi:hypothetical protein